MGLCSLVTFRHFALLLVLVLGREFAGEVQPIVPMGSAESLACVVAGLLLFAACISWDLRKTLRLANPALRFAKTKKTGELAWLVFHPLQLFICGWFPLVAQLGETSAALGYLALILPSVISVLVLEAGASCCDAKERAISWRAAAGLRLRLGDFTGFVVCMAPVVACSSLFDIFHLFQGYLNSIAVALGVSGYSIVTHLPQIISVCALLVVLATLPIWLGRWVGVEPLRGSSLGGRVEYFQERLGLKTTPVLVPSNRRWHGAAIVGWLPCVRRLWLGDGLVQELNRQELDMVLLHEFAHITRKHFLWRALPLVWAVGINLCYLSVVSTLDVESVPMWVMLVVKIGASLLAAAVLILGLGHVSRSCELDADREACRLAELHCRWAEKPGTAEATLATALSKLMGGGEVRKAKKTWMHPSLRERLGSLAAALANRRKQLANSIA